MSFFSNILGGTLAGQVGKNTIAGGLLTKALDHGTGNDIASLDAEIAALESQLANLPSQTQQAYQPPGNQLLENIKGDVTRRLFANQAARGKLGSGSTISGLATSLAPIELQQRQQDISNLYNLFALGSNAAAGQGSAGISASQGIGSALQAGGLAQAQGQLGSSNAIGQGLGSLAGIGGYFFGGSPQTFTGELGGIGGYRPIVQGSYAAGPLTSSGSFYGS